MKLRNFMYATMIACTFASCSKDDVNGPDNGGQQGGGDATLEVNLNIKVTKALNGDDAGDATINNLTLIVFNGNTAEAVVTTNGTDNKGSGAVSVKTIVSGGQKTVTLLANASSILSANHFTKGSSLSDLANIKNTLSNEGSENFTMNSALYTVALTPGKVNYLGYSAVSGVDAVDLNTQVGTVNNTSLTNGVTLYRNVAKICLNNVEFDVDNNKYPNASFSLSKVFVLHAKQNTSIYNAKEWGTTEADAVYFNGVANDTYEDYVSTMAELLKNDAFKTIFGYITDNTGDVYSLFTTTADLALTKDRTFTFSSNNKVLTGADGAALETFYVYENTNDATKSAAEVTSTMLVLEGTFASDGISETRYYSLAIGRTATDGIPATFNDAYKFSGRTTSKTIPDVLRNLQYNVNLKIKGMGYTTPFGPGNEGGDNPDGSDNAVLDVRCQVAAWGEVNQVPEI